MNSNSIQSTFLEQIRKRLPENLSFAEDLAEVLNISRDSAYRRLRGETVLSLDEVGALCAHYKVSLDSLFYNSPQLVTFHYQAMSEGDFTYEKQLQSIAQYLSLVSGFPQNELIYSAKDIPIFYYFMFPELGNFKMFFWMKSLLRYKKFETVKFSSQVIPRELTALGKKIWELYAGVTSTEIWSNETINVTLNQIEFYKDCGFFENPNDAALLLDQYISLLEIIKGYASEGIKDGKGKFDLYKNDILIANNTIFFKMGDKRAAFLPHNMLDILTTSHDYFCQQTEKHLNTLINKSTLISSTAEKERNRFFNQITTTLELSKKKLKSD